MSPAVVEKLGLFGDDEALARSFRAFDTFYEQYVHEDPEGYSKFWLFGVAKDSQGQKALVTVHHRVAHVNDATQDRLLIAGTNGDDTVWREWEVIQVREELYPVMHPRPRQRILVLRDKNELTSLIWWRNGWGIRSQEFMGACETLEMNEAPHMACKPSILLKCQSDKGYYL